MTRVTYAIPQCCHAPVLNCGPQKLALHAEGIDSVRMARALARGDIDAYVGAEPAGGISLANGTGKLVEYPYSTPIGSLNM